MNQSGQTAHKKEQVYSTMMVLCLACLLAFGYFQLSYFLWAGIALLLMALFVYPLAKWIHRGWMKLAHILGWINTRLLLGILFFLILVPLAFLRKLFSKQHMPLTPDDSDTYFIDNEGRRINFEQPW
ncbi:MAG: SxtJ family membrane protein [Bacteroidota bacterium]